MDAMKREVADTPGCIVMGDCKNARYDKYFSDIRLNFRGELFIYKMGEKEGLTWQSKRFVFV